MFVPIHTVIAQEYDISHYNGNSSNVIDVNLFNRYDDHIIDTTYMGNREVFIMLDSLMRDTAIINHTKRINVVSSSSIEGTVAYNRALSYRRMQTIEATFRSRYNHIAEDMWNFSCIPENWRHLRRAVEDDENVPNQEEVLSIINMEDKHPDTREYMLTNMYNGIPWSYIHQNILPASRGSVSMLFVPMNIIPTSPTSPLVSIPIQNFEAPTMPLATLGSATTQTKYSRPIVSIRSNLLLDLITTINIAVEVPLAPRWSISAEYINPWWKSWDREVTWQIQSLYFDIRYWLSRRDSYNYLNGWSVGAYAGSGCYDLQPFSDRGIQGEYSDYGVTLSFAHFFGKSKHWLMEYTAGLGYVTTHYRNYYTAANTDEYGNIKVHDYPWREETMQAPLPTRLGVTLCYLIYAKTLKKRR